MANNCAFCTHLETDHATDGIGGRTSCMHGWPKGCTCSHFIAPAESTVEVGDGAWCACGAYLPDITDGIGQHRSPCDAAMRATPASSDDDMIGMGQGECMKCDDPNCHFNHPDAAMGATQEKATNG